MDFEKTDYIDFHGVEDFIFPDFPMQNIAFRNGMWEEFKFHLVNWPTVCTPISRRGLEIRHLMKFNQAILGKWMWRCQHEGEALWKSVIDAKFGKA